MAKQRNRERAAAMYQARSMAAGGKDSTAPCGEIKARPASAIAQTLEKESINERRARREMSSAMLARFRITPIASSAWQRI